MVGGRKKGRFFFLFPEATFMIHTPITNEKSFMLNGMKEVLL